jgi:pimeloyl-ACP methyl ester carboxylesterase
MTQTDTPASPKIAKLYEDVPGEQLAQFQKFRAAYPFKHATIDGVAWEYIAAGQVNEPLLLLPGALGVPDMSWQHITYFAGRYRVIAPAYSPVKKMDTLVDGIAGILRRETGGRAHVVGGSYGGFVAQVFVRRHPDMTASLVLSHTLPPDPASGEQIRRALRWLSLMPGGLLRWMVGKRLRTLLPEKTPDTALLHAFFNEMACYRITKEELINSYWRVVDFNLSDFTPQDLTDWPGRVLLIMADDDPGTPEPVRAAMLAFYPEAEVHMFHDTGHAAALLKQDEYLAVVEQFIGD